MPDGTRTPDLRLDRCARTMKTVTRCWAVLEASGPRAGPVREAITELEPVFHAQMVLALSAWVDGADGDKGPANEELRSLVESVIEHTGLAEGAGDEDTPKLTAIDFVQLWPAVLKEMRAGLD